jgi:hypothetical protein
MFPARSSRPQVGTSEIAACLNSATPDKHGRLMLLADFIAVMQGMDAAALALRLLRLCMDSGAYHVQLEGLNTIRTFVNETSGTPLGDEIAACLQSIDLSGNWAPFNAARRDTPRIWPGRLPVRRRPQGRD